MNESHVRDVLGTFGLSETEVDAYLAVLRRGSATAGTVSEAAGISRSYVYEVATSLADTGLVAVDASASPTTLRARPPDEVAESLSARVAEFESAATELRGDAAADRPPVEVVHATPTIRRRVEDYIAAAEHELFLVLPASTFERVAPDLAAAVDRGVAVYCMLTGPDSDPTASALEDPGRYADVVRTWDARPNLFVARDERAGVWGDYRAATGSGDGGFALAFDQTEVGSGLFGHVVSNVWPMGRQRFVGEPPALPDEFDWFRSAVVTAALHTTAGWDVVVDAEAEEIATGERRTLTGVPVREVRQNVVDPSPDGLGIEFSLLVEDEDGLTSVGGVTSGFGPFYEEYAADEVCLERAE